MVCDIDSLAFAEQKRMHIATGNILDWGLTYGAEPCVYIATDLAWWVCSQMHVVTVLLQLKAAIHTRILCNMPLSCRYKLVTPAEDYVAIKQQMQQRLDLCSSAVKLLKHNSSLTPLAAAQNAYKDVVTDAELDEEQQPIISFVEAQVSSWMEVTRHPVFAWFVLQRFLHPLLSCINWSELMMQPADI